MAKRILVIDDEIDVMKMVVYRLKAKGYEVVTAVNGKEGIDLAEEQMPDLILLDLRLPDMLAPEVAKQIGEKEKLRRIPIILITASVDSIVGGAKECGAVDYISKPIAPEELYKKVKNAIGAAS